jgi:signal transduction histidine kinase
LPGLNAGDRKAFSDIAQQLAARLKNSPRPDGAEPRPITNGRPSQNSPYASPIDGRAPATSDDDGGEAADWLAETSDVRAFLDQLPLGVLIYRAQELHYANRNFLETVGYPTLEEFADAGGLDNLLLESTAAKDNGAQTIAIVTADREPTQVEARLISISYCGEPAHALVLAEPAPQGSGSRASIRERDRTMEKILEQQIADVRRRSSETVAEHAEVLAKLGHDIRTPLTAIMGFAETVLGERFGPIGNERYRDYLSEIRNASKRILGLVAESSLSVTPVDAPAPPISVAAAVEGAAVDLNEIVRSSVAELQQDATRNRVLIRTSLATPLPNIAADANAVRQIVLNLMTNSMKLAGAGGQIIISTGVNVAGTVLLRLRDTGIGLTEEDVAAAMRRQPVGGETDEPEGRLKLAVAKALLEANRASLKISSKPNDGTLVEVSFRDVSSAA